MNLAPPGARWKPRRKSSELCTGLQRAQPGADPGHLAQPQEPGNVLLLRPPAKPLLAHAGGPDRGACARPGGHRSKKQIILRHGLALWDTLESCTITGASDASIRDVVPNDIAGLLAKAPIEAVFATGPWHIRSIQSISSRSAASRQSGCPAPAPPMPPAGRKNYGRSGRKNCRTGFCLECRADLPDLPGTPL